MSVARLSRSDLAQLARKYRTLGDLRRTQHHVTAAEVRASLGELAREFPGALRELDALPLDEIDRRAEQLEAAAAAGESQPWMEWVHAYHAAMRAALHVKGRLAGSRSVDDRRAFALAREAARVTGYRCDVGFVQAVARPPHGRLNVVVFERVEAELGVRPGSVWQVLFPERRSLPHRGG